MDGAPTLDVASVRLFKVVLLPDDGLPTRAMSGSRGILVVYRAGKEGCLAIEVVPEGFDERHNVVSGHEGCGSEWMWLSLLLV